MSDEADELGLLGGAELGVGDLAQGVLEPLAVLDEDVVARNHDLAVFVRGICGPGIVIAVD